MAQEKGYRPQTLNDLNGQPKVKKQLEVYLKAANMKNECLDHVLITGPSGCGKTTVAKIIANELGKPYKAYSGPSLTDIADVSEMLMNIDPGTILFIDEVHRMKKKLQEMVYFAMEQYEADVVFDGNVEHISIPHFTLVAATNLAGGLEEAMLNRFPIQLKLEPYTTEAMVDIVNKIAHETEVNMPVECATMIAGCTRGVPRNANSYVRRIVDFALVMNNGEIDCDVVRDAFDFMDINRYGLNRDDVAYLTCLSQQKKVIGIKTIAMTINVDENTVATKIEPYLLQKGYIYKAPKGRAITTEGRKVLEG